jgi:membrane protease subunit HflK
MAWNEPGGNGGRDPWGNRGGQQGPPDLDEVLKKLRARWGRFFGGRSGGGGGGFRGPSFRGGGLLGVGLIALLVVVAWGVSGIYIVDPAEEAVVLRFGKFVRTEGAGPHWAPPLIETVEKVNVEEIRDQEVGFRRQGNSKGSVPNEALMLTEDENIVDIQFAIQYRVKDAAAFLFNVDQPELTLRAATESAVREIVGRSAMDFVITGGRDAVAAEAEELIQEIIDRYGTGLQITSLNMQDAQPPAQVQDAFFDAIKAREDQERIINEANAYKADVVPKARGEATAVLQRAEAYRERVIAQAEGETSRFLQVLEEYQKAPEITRERLYIETVESVMINSSKVMVDVKGGNNLMYLPLDRLLQPREPSVGSDRIGIDAGEGRLSGESYQDPRRSRESIGGRTR